MSKESRSLGVLLLALLFCGCTKEIDFDYHTTPPVVVIEGRVTNEGTEVMVTQSRNVTDSVMGRSLPGALVTVSIESPAGSGHWDVADTVAFDTRAGRYRSPLKGRAGERYRLEVQMGAQHYEGEATMPGAAQILSAEFYWFTMFEERVVVYEMWAKDPSPAERNYYWYRMDRRTSHPQTQTTHRSQPYLWNVFDDRGNPPGLLFRDVMCMTERMAEKDEEENWDIILYEGDTVTCQLMTIDRATYDYLTSLRAGQSGGANPKTNMTGGCQGYFTAGTVTRADTIVFSYGTIKPEPSFVFK